MVLKNYLQTVDSDWYKQRITGVIICILAAFAMLMLRLFYLQVIKGVEFRRLSENNCIRLQSINFSRGLIFDRTGTLLVDNRPSFDLCIIVKDAKPVERTLARLSKHINIPTEELLTKIEKNRGFLSYKPVLLKQDIGRNLLASVEAHKFDLPGVIVNIRQLRHYINERGAAHLIGYLSEINSDELKSGKYPGHRGGDFIGKFGAEKAYEKYLSGKRGGRQVEVNASGQIVRILKTVDAIPGHNIYLTIDTVVQNRAEKLLKGLAGAVAAMDPTTGHILAMASSPSFNQNAFVGGMSHKEWNCLISNPFRPMENKVVQGMYPPASIYKIITAIAGIEEGIIDKKTTVYCRGQIVYGNRTFRCWKKSGHGSCNVVKALAESCDVFFYQVGQKLGPDRLAWYAKACGLESPTGINLDHEASGLIPTAAWKKRITGVKWQGGESLSAAIGQGYNLVTPLQMLVLISAVANGGTRYVPLILKTIETAEGKTIYKSTPCVTGTLPGSKQTLKLIKKGLWEAINSKAGTAWGVHFDNIDISGKTGTAQVVSSEKQKNINEADRAHHLKPHAWFVAYAPSTNPRIAVVVLIEHGEHGSKAAAPIAKEIIKTYFDGIQSFTGDT